LPVTVAESVFESPRAIEVLVGVVVVAELADSTFTHSVTVVSELAV
jgi:hypothetical protein